MTCDLIIERFLERVKAAQLMAVFSTAPGGLSIALQLSVIPTAYQDNVPGVIERLGSTHPAVDSVMRDEGFRVSAMEAVVVALKEEFY